jgi:xanthine dehydrogenase iron-sulfur cluster and FAD-binding subunit A
MRSSNDMTLQELLGCTQGRLLTGGSDPCLGIRGAGAADLMSDVLACVQPGAVLLTGLCNLQVVRTAQMADVAAVVFVRGKLPEAATIALADAEGIPLISSPLGLFELCGRLYARGLPSLERQLYGAD